MSELILSNPKKNVIIRILGNDLTLVHSAQQTYSNLVFTIDHEPEFDNTDKIYLLNRIFDLAKRSKIIEVLNTHQIPFIELPFEHDEFARIPKLNNAVIALCEEKLITKSITKSEKDILSKSLADYRLYIMNINAARNYCIKYGKENGYEWIFVLDSNNFFTKQNYDSIISNISSDTEYITIPQVRVYEGNYSNETVLLSPEKLESLTYREHQLAFKNTSEYIFNDAIPYGTYNKCEFLTALGVPGEWLSWTSDIKLLNISQRVFKNARYQTLSKIIRLSPDNPNNNITTNWINRMLDTYLIVKELQKIENTK